MATKEYKRPDEAAIQRVLIANKWYIAGTIILLAWKMGLSREEMYQLRWSDISFEKGLLCLPDRTVPMDEESKLYLQSRYEKRGGASDYVVVSDRQRTRMMPQSISRCARTALDRGGLTEINLVDLRHDFVIRQLEEHDWPYVARICGSAVTTLYTNYSEYFANRERGKAERPEPAPVDTEKLRELIERAEDSPEGLTLWMCWKLGLRVSELIALTWDQIDMDRGTIALPDRTVQAEEALMQRLFRMKANRKPDADPHVLLTPHSQIPYDYARISRAVRTALIRGGMEKLTLRDVVQIAQRKDILAQMVKFAAENGSITRNQAMDLLKITKVQAYDRLQRLVEEGRLVKVGARYYPAGAVVPPEQQYAVIRAHLEKVGHAYRQELSDLLHIENKQCGWILQKLVAEGKLERHGQMYVLPERKEEKT